MIETFQLITLAVCCGYVSNLIGRRTINIPEIILGVRGLMGFTVNDRIDCTFLSELQSKLRSCQAPKISTARVCSNNVKIYFTIFMV